MMETTELSKTLAGKEYEDFLSGHGFRLISDTDGEFFSCTVFQSRDMLLAFTYQMNFGENLAVAEPGAPVDVECIANRTDGWSLIGEVWADAYTEFHTVKQALPYPHVLDRAREIVLIDRALRIFVEKVRKNEVKISQPVSRLG